MFSHLFAFGWLGWAGLDNMSLRKGTYDTHTPKHKASGITFELKKIVQFPFVNFRSWRVGGLSVARFVPFIRIMFAINSYLS